ncbi:DUF6543 domain-containing protein [Pseudomonas sp.]|uniref:dermonecrotic toxin domain-containing protein n=1 Tax=Pseudomonas sp. TaxID=306 RepID=UPI002619CE4A|nr:DUF6543 domain-containing protein [Pseudomonas sp.]
MLSVTPPYFFDEFLRPVSRKTPSERERALGLSVKDLEWLHNLYYVSDTDRQNTRLLSHPMRVEKLLINAQGHIAIPLAGAFMMSPTPDGGKALLYTPYGGIQVFADPASLLVEVGEQLADSVQRVDLMSFLSITQRNALPIGTALTVTSAVIEGAVSEDQEQTLMACQQANVNLMLEHLKKIPTLPWMLDTVLIIMARNYFPGLDQRHTRVNFFIRHPADGDRRWVQSLPLSEAFLQFYVKHAWPTEQTREFFNPKHVTTAFTQAQLEEDNQRWEALVEETSGVLSKLLDGLLQTYWNEDIGDGASRVELFAQIMGEKFRVDVLLKRQTSVISAEESHMFQAMFLPDESARSAHASQLSVEKVQVYAPYQHYVELASTLMIHESHAYLYTQSHGVQVLKDMDDLRDTLLTMLKTAGHEDELLNFLSLDERNTFIGLDQVNIAARPVTGSVFTGIVEDIAVKQISNMNHALATYRRSDGQVNLTALLDYALDVRAMLDARLALLDTNGRWTTHPITSGNGRPSTVRAERAKQQLQRLHAVEQALDADRKKHPTLRGIVAHALNAELNIQQLDLKAEDVYINTYETRAEEIEERPPVSSLNMVEHFIERLSLEASPVSSSPRTWFYVKRDPHVALQLHNLTLSAFNSIIERVLKLFSDHDMHELTRVFLDSNRDKHAHSMLLGLRSEAELRLLGKLLDPTSHGLLDTVLNPESLSRITRHGINGFMPDAYGLTLGLGSLDQPTPLANVFVITERGGIDPKLSGQAVLWTPRSGYEVFISIMELHQALTQRLEHPIKRLSLLENLPVSLRIPHQVYRLGPLKLIDDNVLDNRLKTYRDFVMDGVDHLLSMKLRARSLQNRLDMSLEQAPPTNLARAVAVATTMINQQALPVWLGMAPPREQIHQAELLEQYHNNAPQEEDYLHGIVPLRAHTFAALAKLLDARFPGHALSPDNILIPIHQAFEIHDYSLTDYAMRHLPNMDTATIRPRSRTATPLPATLDATAVIQMVRQLDLKTAYQTVLQNQLNDQSAEALQRRRLFCQQLPWQTLQLAHEQMLQERLSAQALSLVQQVFDMPDALARASLAGASARVRPMELIATEGATAVKVLGMYLIDPTPPASGPVVLYAPYRENHVFKEYRDEQALLDELDRPGELQDWVLLHLDDPHQATYRHLMQENLRRVSDIHLASSEVTGNFLHYLFNDNTLLLSKMLSCQFVEGAKVLWEKVTELLVEEIPTAVQFMAGKLAYPLVVWRSYKLFKRSAEALQLHRWKSALKDFVLGIAQMAALRDALEGLDSPPPTDEAVPAAKPSDETLPTATTLSTLDITAPSRTSLQPFEHHDIALEDLERNASSHVYEDKATSKTYIPLAGKVYSVEKTARYWCLANDEQQGSYVARNSQGHWVLDLRSHNPRFGGLLGHMSARSGERREVNIEARGIREIAAVSSWKAQVINEAMNVATFYTVTCKRNIALFSVNRDPFSRVGLFLGELFGVLSLTPAQLERVEKIVDLMLDELSNPTLTKPDSSRFVSGTSRTNRAADYALTLPDDTNHTLYLLDRFFDPQMDMYQNCLISPFDISAHARASTIIHEVTHLKLDTEDIAYLHTMCPFPELIDPSKPGAQALKTTLEDLHSTALSTLTPASMLFKTWDKVTLTWKDYSSKTSTSSLKQKILTVTGARDLNDARQIFMSSPDKRIDTILSNADSVTYLITHLGRVLDPGA